MIGFKTYLEESADAALKKKADKSGFSLSILKQVYRRGVAAWKVGHKPGTTPQQWGMARVNSFITGGRTRVKGDPDLWKKQKSMLGKKKKVKESVELDEGAKTHFVYQKGVPKTKQVVHRGTEQSAKDWITKNAKFYIHKGKDFDIYKGKYPNVKPSDRVDFRYVAEAGEELQLNKLGDRT